MIEKLKLEVNQHQAQKYTGAKNGWIVTEFLSPVFY
jgi:hypothetical protein